GTNHGLEIELSVKCYPYYPEISPEARRNRALLIGLFESEDFICDLKVYWHFDYGSVIWAIKKRMDYAIYGPISQIQNILSATFNQTIETYTKMSNTIRDDKDTVSLLFPNRSLHTSCIDKRFHFLFK
nr:hypothetical protein [Bacteroidota bacterium]